MRHDRPRNTPPLLYHYTSLKNLESILNNGIRLYQASKHDHDLNLSPGRYLELVQSSESQDTRYYAEKIEEDSIAIANSIVKDRRDRTFITCFTISPINDYLWKNYGDEDKGVCITIQSDMIWRNITHTDGNNGVCSIGEVDYCDDHSTVIDDACNRYRSSDIPLSQELFAPYLLIADYVKASCYFEEQEVRIAFYDWYFHRGLMDPEIEEKYLRDSGFGDIQNDGNDYVHLNLKNLVTISGKTPFVSIWVRDQETLEKARKIVSRSRYPSTRVLFTEPPLKTDEA